MKLQNWKQNAFVKSHIHVELAGSFRADDFEHRQQHYRNKRRGPQGNGLRDPIERNDGHHVGALPLLKPGKKDACIGTVCSIRSRYLIFGVELLSVKFVQHPRARDDDFYLGPTLS